MLVRRQSLILALICGLAAAAWYGGSAEAADPNPPQRQQI